MYLHIGQNEILQDLDLGRVVFVARVHRCGIQQFIFCHAGSPFRNSYPLQGKKSRAGAASGPFLLALTMVLLFVQTDAIEYISAASAGFFLKSQQNTSS